MDDFYNYRGHKGFWFVFYLQWAGLISEDKERYSIKNGFDIKEEMETDIQFKRKLERLAWE